MYICTYMYAVFDVPGVADGVRRGGLRDTVQVLNNNNSNTKKKKKNNNNNNVQ